MNALLQDNNGNQNQVSAADSITLGQLKAMVGTVQKPKQSLFDFKYDDEDTVMNEIEEFYSYIEMPQVAENMKAWEGSYHDGISASPNTVSAGEWTKSSISKRRAHVDYLLESLEHRDTEVRFTNARRLFYVLQGTFGETVSPEHQLHWIFENCKVVRAANGVSAIVEALKIAGRKHDLLCNISDQQAAHLHISVQDKSDLIEEVLTEVSVYLGMLYHLIEVFKGHDDFADELMSLDPPLPVYLFNVVSNLRDKTAKGYPIKKLLLVLWKTLLTCWGGVRDHARVKKLARELAGLPPASDTTDKIKSSPIDIDTFHTETSVKYPTFTPPAQPPPSLIHAPIAQSISPSVLTRRLAKAYTPIPVRHHYHHDDDGGAGMPMQFAPPPPPPGAFRHNPQPPTPAPSPPPPPPNKPKKQQYQTDQSRPFLFPFAKGQPGARRVPFAVDEADTLYSKHMYISLALAQMWRTRDDCMTAESGLDRMPGAEEGFKSSTFDADEAEAGEPLPDLALLDKMIDEAAEMMTNAQTSAEKRKAQERREDLMRLKRVEQIYSAILPVLSGWVLILLKLLLATVSASSNASMQAPQSSTSSVFPPAGMSPQEQAPSVPPTLDDIDVTRHREITSKAVSAILLLVLKWFKVSHIMKFHHLGQHLLDTNCLLLILKMFGLQEVTNSVVSKVDSPENNFFRYCLTNLSKNPQPIRPEDDMYRPPKQSIKKFTTLPSGEKREEEIDLITEYSWRNFFSTINFAKIMQKLSKGRSHRIWMLVQYKSSAVLKRVLRVNHPMLQLHVLKLIKSQVPFCGRKWRQSNMKVITAIYLNCRPDLRDEWLAGIEPDDAGEAQAQEQALRHLVKFYNTKRYGPAANPNQQSPIHRRSGSMSQMDGLHSDPALSSLIRPIGTPNVVDSDVFPPARSRAPDHSLFLPFIPEDIAFEEEYEEYLSDLGWADDQISADNSMFTGGTSAWHRLPNFVSEMTESISDSESVVTIEDLGDEGHLDPGHIKVVDENVNNWEHMSPKTMAALPKSPAGGRRGSGQGLRPVLPFALDEGSAIDDEDDVEPTHLGREPSGEFPAGASVDEVEYAYG
ncbi:hypothetical protein HYPSUDRAFT_136073 [Hypholoma sublateritium FD-334 SS-4]|uniref:N1221-domain-containing protein n=1 Tax=Hypholoma sublateritium (strain FD-334 SS-4) TaxID=945553 RepID=A0A0D2P0X3_HYPSF|nr:hypothetical protein HYPSUDRAFT_136073 [Hypholoma sublateritium FD-334 SS-4]